jgi:hypothetical protein
MKYMRQCNIDDLDAGIRKELFVTAVSEWHIILFPEEPGPRRASAGYGKKLTGCGTRNAFCKYPGNIPRAKNSPTYFVRYHVR